MSAKTIEEVLGEMDYREKAKLTTQILRGNSVRPWLKQVANISKGLDPNAPWDKKNLAGRTQTIKAIAFDLLRARYER